MRPPSAKVKRRLPHARVLIELPLNLVWGADQPERLNRCPETQGDRGSERRTPHHVVGVGDVYARGVRKVKAPEALGRRLYGVGLVLHRRLGQPAEPVLAAWRQRQRGHGRL